MIFLMTAAQDIVVQNGRIFSTSDPDFRFALNTNAFVADSQGETFIWVDRFPVYPEPDSAVFTISPSQFSPFSPVGSGEAGALIGVLKDVDEFLALRAEDPTFLPGWSAYKVTQTGLVPHDPLDDISIVGLWAGALPPEGDLAGSRVGVIGNSRLGELVEAAGGIPVPFTDALRLGPEMEAGTIAGAITTRPIGVEIWDRGEFGYDLFTAEIGADGFSNAMSVGRLPFAERGLTPDPQPGPTPDPVDPPIDGAIQGSAQSEELNGTAADDLFEGMGGNDTLTGGRGDDVIDGGAGSDTAVYTGGKAAHTVTFLPSGISVEDRRPNGDGTDQLTSIENLSFLDTDWPLDIFDNVVDLSEQAFRDFIEVYIAYFNRAPDAEGLFFYGTAFANGTSLDASAATFLNSAEYQATYPPGLSNQEFAEAVYDNVLGRIPDLLGLNFWVGALDSGGVGRDTFILEVLKGAKAPAPDDATQDFIDQKAADVAYLANKTDVGLYFSVIKGMSNVDNATAAMQLFDDGDQNDIYAAVAAIDGFYADALDPVNGEFLLQLIGVVDDPFLV